MSTVITAIRCLSVLMLVMMLTSKTIAAPALHAVAMHGEPKYPSDFKHFSYADPDAIKGGHVTLGALGGFDSLNPFIIKGNAADGIELVYDALTVASNDESFTQYGLVAKGIELPNDRTWVIFHLRTEARFHDGHPLTAKDVVFSFHALMQHGSPVYKSRYADVKDVKAIDAHTVRFDLGDGRNKELALIVGQLPILPAHYWQGRDFSKEGLEPPLGSGPYRIKRVDAGRSITYERVKDYWAQSLPVNVGRYNFDEIQYDYYRDSTVMLEALKAGAVDFRYENSSKQWATAYESPAISSGLLKKEEIRHENPTGMQAFVFNLRNPMFQDPRVREALNYAFDFEWTNKQLFYNAYTRTDSFFSNSELASTGVPAGKELEILKPFKGQVEPRVFTQPYTNPLTDGSGYNRNNLREAMRLLKEAGWQVQDGVLTEKRSGMKMAFDFLVYDTTFERVINPYLQNLKKLGIQANVRMVEVSQYINRLRSYDYQVIVANIPQSLSPGNEQIEYWHSSTVDSPGGNNLIGVKNPVIDQLIQGVIAATSPDDLIAHTRALDRVLLSNHYVIPQWHIRHHRIAYWDRFSRPAVSPRYDGAFGTGFLTWWIDPDRDVRIQNHRQGGK